MTHSQGRCPSVWTRLRLHLYISRYLKPLGLQVESPLSLGDNRTISSLLSNGLALRLSLSSYPFRQVGLVIRTIIPDLALVRVTQRLLSLAGDIRLNFFLQRIARKWKIAELII